MGRDIIEAALAFAPKSMSCRAGHRDRDVLLWLESLVVKLDAGALYATVCRVVAALAAAWISGNLLN